MLGHSGGIKIVDSKRKNRIFTVTYTVGSMGTFKASFYVGALGPICNHVSRGDGSMVDVHSGIDYRHYDAFLHVFTPYGDRNNTTYIG